MKKKNAIIGLIISIIIMAIDQVIKHIITSNMILDSEIKVLGDIFTIHYIRNTGTAWGMLSGHTIILVLVSIFTMMVIGYVFMNIYQSHYTPLRVCLAMILGGALGNFIDRIRLHYVVDYLYFKLINFPVFNFADIFVTVPVIIMILLVIFKYKGDDFDVIMGDKILTDDGEYIEKRNRKSE